MSTNLAAAWGASCSVEHRALEDASRDWLCATTSLSPGIGVVYEWFVSALTGSPYEDLATGARARWRQRVDEWRRWPKFMVS